MIKGTVIIMPSADAGLNSGVENDFIEIGPDLHVNQLKEKI